jgi:peptidoglycan/LPS O-acetylase OafA/YrhL
MRSRRLRHGESIALAGAIAVAISLTLPWYENAHGKLDAWDTFGAGVALLIIAGSLALMLAVATVSERSPAWPITAAVWGSLLGFFASIAALIRVLERPQHATMLCAGAWLGLAGALLILLGCWLSMGDERTDQYTPVDIPPRRLG